MRRSLHRLVRRPLLGFGLAVTACGGGGGGGETDVGAPAPAGPSLSTRLEDLLASCVLEGVAAFEATMAKFEPVLEGEGAPEPDLEVTGIDLLGASVSFALDADADAVADVTGTMRFLDAAGAPTWPFAPTTLLALLAGTADLPALLATLPDGTTVGLDYALVGAVVPVTGALETTFADGLPTTATGDARFPGAACQVGLAFADLPATLLYDPAPAGVFDLHGTTAEGALEGTLTLHGDGTATFDLLLDGTEHGVWDYDLATGALTKRP
jgi:hypothetical protein